MLKVRIKKKLDKKINDAFCCRNNPNPFSHPLSQNSDHKQSPFKKESKTKRVTTTMSPATRTPVVKLSKPGFAFIDDRYEILGLSKLNDFGEDATAAQ